MTIMIEVPEYDTNYGLVSHWEDGFEISVNKSQSDIVIKANKAGLTSLAIQLLTLAQDEVPVGSHFHYDQYGALENGSKDLIIEKGDSVLNI